MDLEHSLELHLIAFFTVQTLPCASLHFLYKFATHGKLSYVAVTDPRSINARLLEQFDWSRCNFKCCCNRSMGTNCATLFCATRPSVNIIFFFGRFYFKRNFHVLCLSVLVLALLLLFEDGLMFYHVHDDRNQDLYFVVVMFAHRVLLHFAPVPM